MDNLLTHIETAGSQGILSRSATREERKALALHLTALRAAGHAIVADEVMEHGEASGDLRVFHYLSCVKCKRTVL